MTFRTIACLLALTAFNNMFLRADEGSDFFEKKVRPVFAEHCYKCHSADSKKIKGGLRLDTIAGIRKGGDTGPLFVPGKPRQSLLVTAIRHEETSMPPDGKIASSLIDDVVAWVEKGAPLPPDTSAGLAPRREAFRISPEDRDHWSFRPLKKQALPAGNADSAIDRFVQARLQSAGLKSAPPADRYTLLRRLTYDLTGLPPTVDEIQAFVNDRSPEALEKVVDRLLASKEFGAHWGRHWLDGVRYATDVDKSGRYREWVVRAVNNDLPYDRFLQLQLAGDLLPAGSSDASKIHVSGASLDGIAATGMLSLAVWELVARDLAVAEIVDSQIDVVGRQILGLTLACARCHDHKFDPVSADDYYGLAGIFFSSHISPGKLIADGRLSNEVITVPLLSKTDDAHNRKLDEQIARVTKSLLAVPGAERLEKVKHETDASEAKLKSAKAAAEKTKLEAELKKLREKEKDATAAVKADDLARIQKLRAEIAALQKKRIVPPDAIVTQEGGVPGSNREKIADAPILIRGDFRKEGAVVHRHFPVILGEEQPKSVTGSGRLELARWITRPDHPLTSRVMVNRIWLHLFGEGLVRTPDNFGRLGEKPTHPELLDHLATRFVEQGWSVKKLIREMILTKTYQQSSFGDPAVVKADPANFLLARMNRKRLSYESLRDSLYFVSGQLTSPGEAATGKPMRTMFEPIERSKGNDMRAMFDGPDPKEVVSGRADSTSAPQALFMLNNKLMFQTTGELSSRLYQDPALNTDAAKLRYAYQKLLGRPPTDRESELAIRYIKSASWTDFLQVLLCTNEFIYVD